MFIYRRPLSAILAAFITLLILLSIEAMAAAPAAQATATAACTERPASAARRTRGHPGKGSRVRRTASEEPGRCAVQTVTSKRRPG